MAKRNRSRVPAPVRFDPAAPCPCGLDEPYGDCCGRFHSGRSDAPTAELLMRSRYSAFAVGDAGYLLRTWHPTTRPPALLFDTGQRWRHLRILDRAGGGLLDTEGSVEFHVESDRNGERDVMRENGRFTRHEGRWVYLGPVHER